MTVLQGNLMAPFSTATKPSFRGRCYIFSWIARLYSRKVPYNIEC